MREGWKEIKLGDYYDIRSGLSKPASEFGKGFPFLSFKEVFNNYFLPEKLEGLVNTTDSERKKMSVKKGDVFLTRTSETNDELGMSSVALKDYENATFNGFCKRLRPKKNNDFDLKFIGFSLRSPKFRGEVSQYSNLTTRASLNNEIINRLKILIPPLPTQQKIASVLSAYDDLIENNLKRIEVLEEMAQQTYEEWFVRMKYPGYESDEINPETGLPEGWEEVKVNDVIKRFKSTTKIKKDDYLEKGAIPIIDQSRDFIVGFTDDESSRIKYENKPHIVFGDHTRILKLIDFDFARGADGTQIVVSKEVRMPQILFFYALKNIDLTNYHYARHFKYLKDSDIILPDLNTSNKYEEKAKEIFHTIKNLRIQNQHLREARDLLLPRLMMGLIDVEEILA